MRRHFHRLLSEGGRVKIANIVTLMRGVSIVPIVALLWFDLGIWALILYIAAALTDMLDGWLARRSGRQSDYGSALDAAIDNVFSVAILAFLLMAFPGLGERHPFALFVLFGGPLIYLAVSLALTGRLMMFHFWSAKIGALLLFALWPVEAFTGHEELLLLAAGIVGLSRMEQVVFILRGGRDLDANHGLAAPQTHPPHTENQP